MSDTTEAVPEGVPVDGAQRMTADLLAKLDAAEKQIAQLKVENGMLIATIRVQAKVLPP